MEAVECGIDVKGVRVVAVRYDHTSNCHDGRTGGCQEWVGELG